MPTTNDPYENLFGRPVHRVPPANAEGPATPKTPASQSDPRSADLPDPSTTGTAPDNSSAPAGGYLVDNINYETAEQLIAALRSGLITGRPSHDDAGEAFIRAAHRLLQSDDKLAEDIANDISYDEAFQSFADFASRLSATPKTPASKSNKDTADAVDALRFANLFGHVDKSVSDKPFTGNVDHVFSRVFGGVDYAKHEQPITRCPAGHHKWGPWKQAHPGILRDLGPRYLKFIVQSSTCTKCPAVRVRKHRVYRPFFKEFSTRLPQVDRWWIRIPAALIQFPLHLLAHLIVSILACIISTIQTCRGIDDIK